MHKLSFSLLFAFSFFAFESFARTFRCGDLFSKPGFQIAYMNAAEVPMSVTREGNYQEWIQSNFLDLIVNSPMRTYSPVKGFTALSESMKAAGLQQNPPIVVPSSDGVYSVIIDFTKTNPVKRDELYLVRSQFVVHAGGTSFRESLSFYNYEAEVFGFVKKGEDLAARSAKIAALRRQATIFFRDNSFRWNPKVPSEWVSYLRSVLNELIVPIAIKDLGIKAVGIGFSPDATIHSDSQVGAMPGLIVVRQDSLDLNRRSPTILLSPKQHAKMRIGGVDISYEPIPDPSQDGFLEFKMGRELVVFDEFQDLSLDGSFWAIDRTTGRTVPLYYHASQSRFLTTKPPANDKPPVPNKLYKLSSKLQNRVTQFDSAGYNPRVLVEISYQDGRRERKILSILDIKTATNSVNVLSIIEVLTR